MGRLGRFGFGNRFSRRGAPVCRRLFSVAAILALSLTTASPVPEAAARSTQLCQVAAPTTFKGTITNADRLAAAKRAAADRAACTASRGGATPSITDLNPTDYFGTTPNYANSPLPTSDASVSITGGGGTGATADATVVNGVITAIAVSAGGSGYTSAPSVAISGGHGAGAVATASVTAGAVTAISVENGGAGYASGGIRKFVDSLPGLTSGNTNDLGQYLPVAIPDTTTYPGSDYYEIAVVQFRQQLNKDLPATLLRGYVQLETPFNASSSKHVALANANLTGPSTPILDSHSDPILAYDDPQYLGPTIIAQRNVPVRVKFTNLLPAGVAGNLFIPVDTTVMGAGGGPLNLTGTAPCDPMDPAQMANCAQYSENRATLHLHGGVTPWISDGTPNQWITPAGQVTQYPKGVSVVNVPDMPDPGPNSETFFYTNQQSARLMFYHDHSYGITRLNVYSGEAAGYILSDSTEAKLISDGVIPSASSEIPLVIQDKTFVPGPTQLAQEDPTWSTSLYGGMGNLWFPHVYMPNQNPADAMGVNAMGRWDYGPWFWPPFVGGPSGGLVNGPVANPLAFTTPEEGAVNPGIPNPSIVPEGFMDTPLVNGTAYPYLQVGEKAYRLRILNASNDRTLNLQLYCAASNGQMWDSNGKLVNPGAGEVPMVSASTGTPGTAGLSTDILDGRAGGVPNQDAKGPTMIQIGTEGGFLPNPVTLSNSPIGYEYNRRSITVLNVSSKNLMLGPAERADVIVDFSQVDPSKCSNIILYNDSPAPVPAFDPRYDYYTGDADQTSTGGAPTTFAGFGPNTRTIMQFQVTATKGVAPAFNAAALNTALPAAFAASQDPIIVPESAYSTVYGQPLTDHYVNIADTTTTFTPVNTTTPVTNMPLQPKAIQELFEVQYGRMDATLGVELPNTTGINQTTIPLGYAEPYTEAISASDLATPIGSLGDGTQIWKITHNGVDTHFIHFHLFNVQVLNRVGWDGMVKPPDPNELGWKDTVRMNPLEDTIVALRPVAPKVPFGIPDSVRSIDVTRPTTAQMPSVQIATYDVSNGNPQNVGNTVVDYGWEYVWHCHILGHEENDMMRPVKFNFPRAAADAPVLSLAATSTTINLSWTDGTPPATPFGTPGTSWGNPKGEIAYIIERADVTNPSPFAQIGTALANQTTYVDTPPNGDTYQYRVTAFNVGADFNVMADSVSVPASAAVAGATAPSPPLAVTAAAGVGSATVTWTAPAANGGSPVQSYDATASGVGGQTCHTTTALTCNVTGLTPGTTYTFTVTATNVNGTSGPSAPSNAIVPPTVPDPPTSVTAVGGNGKAYLAWVAPLNNGGSAITGYTATVSGGAQSCTTTGALFCAVTGLANGTPYTFTVIATNAQGPSGPSAASNSATPAPTVPGKPTAVTAVAGNASAAVTWTAPADTGGSAITLYTVTPSPDGQACTSSGTGCTVTGLTNGTEYTFTVVATNTTGNGPASDPSAVVLPTAPWTVSLGANVLNVTPGTAVTLTATANQNIGSSPQYLVIKAPNGSVLASCAWGTTCSTIVSSGVSTSLTYTAVIGTISGGSPVATSYPVTVEWQPLGVTVPGKPGNVVATSGNTSVSLTWIAPNNGGSVILGYVVTETEAGLGIVTCTPTGLNACTVSGLTNGIEVTFTVTANNVVGNGLPSVPSNPVTPSTRPGKPAGVTALGADSSAAVSWTAPASNGSAITSYTVTSSPGGKTCTTAHLSCVVSGLTNATLYTFSVVATNGVGPGLASDPSAAVLASAGFSYHAISPTRVLDSRLGLGASIFHSRTKQSFQVTGGSIPASAVAISGNVTIVDQTNHGWVAVAPSLTSGTQPGSSTINFPDSDIRANGVIVSLGSGGTLDAMYWSNSTSDTVQVVFDVTGYYANDAGATTFHAIAPSRVLDSRIGLGQTVFHSRVKQTFQVTGAVVPLGALAVTGNVTVVDQTSNGWVAVAPSLTSGTQPGSSTINFPVGDIRANNITVSLGSGGKLDAMYWTNSTSDTVNVVFDVTGYYDAAANGATFHAMAPTRVLDSRNSQGAPTYRSRIKQPFQVVGGSVPSTAVAVTGNVTVVNQTAGAWVAVAPLLTTGTQPGSSTINFPIEDIRANGITVTLGSGGTLDAMYWSSSTADKVDTIFDVTGYMAP
jgi:FtsP/CotA-like multicopper oxidase with cupredoxin domain